ncbi:junctional sarcoplasmic reticulum protein 1 [Clinocottus analis]|uniref:junctional sarcoplasmic reticulum protein 1 n=1 Tax=Clinocottus analis TaxID=304258 RepID=UPI0035C20740
MEESYETFEEELRPPRADPPPQKPVRQILRPEMYATRKVREEMPQCSQQPRAEPKIFPREPSFPRTTLRKASSIQNLTKIQTPWENVTLNRCLFVAITILVLTSGFQRLHETLRGQGAAEEEEVELTVRRTSVVRHKRQPPEPETTLWDVILQWLPDLDDEEEDDDDDDGKVKIQKSKRGATARASRGVRNKPLLDKKLLKAREGLSFKDRRAKRGKDEEIKDKKGKDQKEEPEAAEEEDEEGVKEEEESEKNIKLEEKKKKKDSKG